MRFKEFLLQEDVQDFPILETLSKVKNECDHFLAEIEQAGVFLYRGMSQDVAKNGRGIFLPHRKFRAPRDSTAGFNLMFNTGIELALDIPLVRQSSIFCTNHRGEASEYGDTYFIFPKGDFGLLYSPEVLDSYVHEDTFLREIAGYFGIPDREEKGELYVGWIGMKNMFKKAWTHSGENMERAVHLIKTDDALIEQLLENYPTKSDKKINAEMLCDALFDVFKGHYSTDTGKAIKSEKETLLYKSEGFYAVKRDDLIHLIMDNRDKEGQSPEEFLETYFF